MELFQLLHKPNFPIPILPSTPPFKYHFPSFLLFHHHQNPHFKTTTKILTRGATTSSTSTSVDDREEDVSWGGGASVVEVIGIGSRRDAFFDFCDESSTLFNSSSALASTRFWTVGVNDSEGVEAGTKVELQWRPMKKDSNSRNDEVPMCKLCPCAAILVASAGYGVDHLSAIEFLKDVKLTNGLTVGIILKPFSFEGQRRQDEVVDLVDKLREYTSFCIVVDTDSLLKKEVLTLAEALESANNAVFLAINSISILMSDMQKKYVDHPDTIMQELNVHKVVKILGVHNEAKIGYGAGSSMKLSIQHAVFDCPFIGGNIKDLNGMVVCSLLSANLLGDDDLHSFLHMFRHITGFKDKILVSLCHEPSMEQNMVVTAIIVLGLGNQEASQRKGFLSSLVVHFPFVFSLLKIDRPDAKVSPLDNKDRSNSNLVDVSSVKDDYVLEEPEPLTIRESTNEGMNDKTEILESSRNSFLNAYDPTYQGGQSFERESSWNIGPSFLLAQEWAKEREAIFGANPVLDKKTLYSLPVGVKPSEQPINSPEFIKGSESSKPGTIDDENASFEALMGFYNSTSSRIIRKNVDSTRKQGSISARAALMLETERDSKKKWSPIMEMQYQGGIYKGRCQGGLPEGKGRLTIMGGNTYDGMWRYGKRFGPGAFYFGNGDVFQGSWRDDLMHGKGWFYFHTGDRWYANFWKGKANGESRFYSKNGDIFFGYFKDGWRHGKCLRIDVDGKRWVEIWEEGVLVSCQQLDSTVDAA